MPYWIRLITLTDLGVEMMRKAPTDMLLRSRQIIEKMDGRLLTAFATLGEFDVMSIVEARDEEHMAAIDKAVESTEVYTARNIAALPVAEFLQTVGKNPIFLNSWMHGRTIARAKILEEKAGGTTSHPSEPAAPAAASATKQRKKGVEERKQPRTPASEGKAYVVFADSEPRVRGEVINLAVGGEKDWAGLCFVMGSDEGERLGANGWEVGTTLALAIELEGEKETIATECKVARVDLVGGDTYEVGVEYGGLSRPFHSRFQRFYQRLRRSNQ